MADNKNVKNVHFIPKIYSFEKHVHFTLKLILQKNTLVFVKYRLLLLVFLFR